MPKYLYSAIDEHDQKVRGRVEASSITNARFQLLTRDLRELELRERKGPNQIELTPKRIKPEEVMFFSRQLAAFQRAGIPLIDAVQSIAEEAESKVVKRLLSDVADRLAAGASFSEALGANASMLPVYFVPMVASAELTGQLDLVLVQLATYIERDLDARREIKAALTYPIIILAMSIMVVFVLVSFVLPKFKKFFVSFDAELPLPTRLLLGLADFAGQWWMVMGGLLFGGTLAVMLVLRTETGKYRRDRLMLKLPTVRVIVRYAVTERFCRILSSLIKAGVALPVAMVAAAEGANNRVYRRALEHARHEMERGEGIARPLADTGLFPAAANQMIAIGERTGTIEEQLSTAADFYEVELAHRVKKLTTLFEPAVIVFMGLVVGFVALAMVSAMYGVFSGQSAQ